jgi:hypothetical protein
MLKFVLSLSLILSALISSAGVRDVGTGGGFSEIQFVYYFENTKHLIQFCLENTSTCRLSSQQQSQWAKLLTEVDLIKQQYSVGFVSDSKARWYLKNQKIFVQQTNLYGDHDQEIPESQILALAVSIQLSLSQNMTDDFETTLVETQKSLEQVEFQNKKIGFSTATGSIFFHQLKIFVGSQSLTLLALEDQTTSTTLNSLVQMSYPKIDLNAANFAQITGGLVGDAGLFFGYMNGSRKFQIKFKLDSQNNIIQQSIEIKIALEK